MKVFISVISHGHEELIKKLNCLPLLSKKYEIVIKENHKMTFLESYCRSHGIHFISENKGKGFGENNNIVFNYCIKNLDMKDDDLFIVLNPDLVINDSAISSIQKKFINHNYKIIGINLFKDFELSRSDDSVREYPNVISLFKSFVGFKDVKRLDKSNIKSDLSVDWIAGSFMAFKASHYKKLCGFDERYFMYCEDVDICYRSSLLGHKPIFLPNIKAVHLAQHQNRKLFSKHFFWHVSSALRFQLKKLFLNKFIVE